MPAEAAALSFACLLFFRATADERRRHGDRIAPGERRFQPFLELLFQGLRVFGATCGPTCEPAGRLCLKSGIFHRLLLPCCSLAETRPGAKRFPNALRCHTPPD